MKKLKPLAASMVAAITLTIGVAQAAYQLRVDQDGIESPLSSPTVSSVTPNRIGTSGGSVTILGTEFLDGAEVLVDGQTASTSFVSDTELFVSAPAHAAGSVDVTITNPDTSVVTSASSLEYVNGPVISSITPNTGSMNGGNSIRIDGSYFTDTTQVFFGGVEADSVSREHAGKLNVVTPAQASAGVYDVTVNDEFGSDTVVDGFTFEAPTVADLNFHSPLIGSSGSRILNYGTLNVSGGSGDYTYNWYTTAYSSTAGASWTPVVYGSTATQQVITFSNSNCQGPGLNRGSNPSIQRKRAKDGNKCYTGDYNAWYKIRVDIYDNVTGASFSSNEAILRR